MIVESTTELQGRETKPYSIQKMIVAHDGSTAAEKALNDAVSLARRFNAEVILVHVQVTKDNIVDDGYSSLRHERNETQSDVIELTNRLLSGGIRSRGIVRTGNTGDTLFNLCCEENADLLLMGAYGHGTQDRQTLGSTAEQLLRAVPCPVLTYGPNASSSVVSAQHLGPVLMPISLPCALSSLAEAAKLAKIFGGSLELFHAVDDRSQPPIRWLETECQVLASFLRKNGVRTRWSFMYGRADQTICSKIREIDSPFIIMPLRWRKGLSALTADNVAAHVIRQASIPVLSYRCD